MSASGPWGFATKFTHVAAAASDDTQVESGEPIRVWGIHVSASAAGNALVEVAGTAEVIMRFDFAGAGSQTLDVPFLADRGMQVSTSNTAVTVFHSQPGT